MQKRDATSEGGFLRRPVSETDALKGLRASGDWGDMSLTIEEQVAILVALTHHVLRRLERLQGRV